ncbi:hypothetical protein ACJX0J_034444, partial [Zea mays]
AYFRGFLAHENLGVSWASLAGCWLAMLCTCCWLWPSRPDSVCEGLVHLMIYCAGSVLPLYLGTAPPPRLHASQLFPSPPHRGMPPRGERPSDRGTPSNPPGYDDNDDDEAIVTPSIPYDPMALRKAFEKAVVKRLMTYVPFGVLLSGGLDSSLVAAVAVRHLAGTEAARRLGTKLHSFYVGLEGSPDLKAAREVAEYLGTLHHEFHFTAYDVTTIRASTPMFLMSHKIKSLGVKMVISGEGSDELFGGYLYFHKAPNKEELHRETCRKYDCLRANKATPAWGLEARVPFLDKEFINAAMNIDPEWKMVQPDLGRIEKWVLRKAFDDEEQPFLPKHILYRQKGRFSDGVVYSWIDGLKAHAASNVTNKMLSNAKFIFPHNTPTTKEAYYYRMVFERFFPQ